MSNPRFTVHEDRSEGKAELDARRGKLLSLDLRQALMGLKPFQSITIEDDPDSPYNSATDAQGYLRSLRSAIIYFCRSRRIPIATRTIVVEGTGAIALRIIHKGFEDQGPRTKNQSTTTEETTQ